MAPMAWNVQGRGAEGAEQPPASHQLVATATQRQPKNLASRLPARLCQRCCTFQVTQPRRCPPAGRAVTTVRACRNGGMQQQAGSALAINEQNNLTSGTSGPGKAKDGPLRQVKPNGQPPARSRRSGSSAFRRPPARRLAPGRRCRVRRRASTRTPCQRRVLRPAALCRWPLMAAAVDARPTRLCTLCGSPGEPCAC